MKNRILAVLLAVVMIISVFSISVFADDAAPDSQESTDVSSEAVNDGSEDNAASDDKSDSTATDDKNSGEKEDSTATTEKSWFEKHEDLVVTLGIILAAAIIFFIVYFASPNFRAKFKKFWKDYNAEFKKLVWPTKQQLVRNSAVVFVSIIAFGALLALLDLGFSKGMYGLKDLIKYISPVK